MNTITALIVGIYAISTLIAISIIIVLIFKRKKQKKKESFEERDN